ncbi:MAG TPA: amidase [Chloroflexi bacterium]|nr:amidase [Chloroflexota bacterium]
MSAPPKRPLLSLAHELRAGSLDLEEYLAELEVLFSILEPSIHSFVEEENRFERLRQEAQKLKKKYPHPPNRPPLFGLPVGIKDIFQVDGFPTRAGSRLPPEELQGREASSVSLLKQAGALVMGKTVTTEFAYFAPGPTRNPRNLDYTPGGSSSGSAAAVAAGLSPLATGTQTIGSITRPASFCGIVGYKPSYDRIDRTGVIPLSPSLDHVGIFSNDVAGAELVAGLLCPHWQLAVAYNSPVIGIPNGSYLKYASDEALDNFEAVCRRLSEGGCTLKQVSAIQNFEAIVERHNLILAAEAAQVHSRWFKKFGDLYHEKTAALIEKGREISKSDLDEALTERRQFVQELLRLMDEYSLDLWISPAAPGTAPKGLDSTGDPIMNLPWTHSGIPTINIPSGVNDKGLPMGLQVAGRWYEDETLFAWSTHLEPMIRTDY